MQHILHIAVENDSLPGAKVGGVADVIRDIAPALASEGYRITTLIPSHGYLHRLPGAKPIAVVKFAFRGFPHTAEIYEVPGKKRVPRVRHCVLHHPWIEAYDPYLGRHRIYVHDGSDQPFFTDSNRFACFSAAAAAAAAQGVLGELHILHLHEWHTALVALLRRRAPYCAPLTTIRTVFSIHNLGIQGVRPMSGSDASLEAWFPGLGYAWLDVADPHDPACINLMATGIRLADIVHTVSPGYAEEIAFPSRKPHFYGAEGLEQVIAYVRDAGRLVGILNGCTYSQTRHSNETSAPPLDHWQRILQREILQWTEGHASLPSQHFVANQRLELLQARPHAPETILTTVGRAVGQKVRLLREPGVDGRTALERILDALGDRGIWIILSAGDPQYEAYLAWMASRRDNLIFLNGYSEAAADLLYAIGHLFMMPSSYEPCGISQMRAMQNGCPCVVHKVGGLRDTVQNKVNGFSFQGWTVAEQVEGFAVTAIRAIAMQRKNSAQWQEICRRAAAARFGWRQSAQRYRKLLYSAA